MTEKKKMGFALLSPERRAELARAGAKKAHEMGRAHKWNSETARAAGTLGGQATARKLQEKFHASHNFDTGQIQDVGVQPSNCNDTGQIPSKGNIT